MRREKYIGKTKTFRLNDENNEIMDATQTPLISERKRSSKPSHEELAIKMHNWFLKERSEGRRVLQFMLVREGKRLQRVERNRVESKFVTRWLRRFRQKYEIKFIDGSYRSPNESFPESLKNIESTVENDDNDSQAALNDSHDLETNSKLSEKTTIRKSERISKQGVKKYSHKKVKFIPEYIDMNSFDDMNYQHEQNEDISMSGFSDAIDPLECTERNLFESTTERKEKRLKIKNEISVEEIDVKPLDIGNWQNRIDEVRKSYVFNESDLQCTKNALMNENVLIRNNITYTGTCCGFSKNKSQDKPFQAVEIQNQKNEIHSDCYKLNENYLLQDKNEPYLISNMAHENQQMSADIKIEVKEEFVEDEPFHADEIRNEISTVNNSDCIINKSVPNQCTKIDSMDENLFQENTSINLTENPNKKLTEQLNCGSLSNKLFVRNQQRRSIDVRWIMKQRQQILNSSSKTSTKKKWDTQLYDWFLSQRSQGISVTQDMIQDKGNFLSAHFRLHAFIERHGLMNYGGTFKSTEELLTKSLQQDDDSNMNHEELHYSDDCNTSNKPTEDSSSTTFDSIYNIIKKRQTLLNKSSAPKKKRSKIVT